MITDVTWTWWTWTTTTPQKKCFFGSNLYKIDAMITSLIEILDLHNFESCDKKQVEKHRFFFVIWVFFHEHARITGLHGKGEGISLIPHYHFHPLNMHLDISRAITAESSPLHIASSRTRTGNLWFPSASR